MEIVISIAAYLAVGSMAAFIAARRGADKVDTFATLVGWPAAPVYVLGNLIYRLANKRN